MKKAKDEGGRMKDEKGIGAIKFIAALSFFILLPSSFIL